MAKLKTVLSSALLRSLVVRFCSTRLWKMVQSSTAYRSLLSYKEALSRKKFLNVGWMNWSYGIVLVIILLLLLGTYLDGQSGKYIGKDKKWHSGSYLFTVDFAHPESNIVDTDHSEIPHEHKCAHIMALDDGNYAAQPNNRIIWDIPSLL